MATMSTDNQTLQPLFSIYELDWDYDDDNDLVTEIQVTRAQLENRINWKFIDKIFHEDETETTLEVRCYLNHQAETPVAIVNVLTRLYKVFYSDDRDPQPLFQALFGAEDTQKFAYEFAQENALQWSDLPGYNGSFPVDLTEMIFGYVFYPQGKTVDEQHKAVLDPSDNNPVTVTITTYLGEGTKPKLAITTPEGEYNSWVHSEKMIEYFGPYWYDDLDRTLENL